MNKLNNVLNNEHQGAIAFEYLIVLILMVVAIFGAWSLLSDEIIDKAQDITNFITNNGQNALGTN